MRAGAVGLSGWVALGLLVPMEAGVPIPLPADLVMFSVGERVAVGAFPLWLAVAGFEVISVIGTSVLFLACRGPAHRVIARFGPRPGAQRGAGPSRGHVRRDPGALGACRGTRDTGPADAHGRSRGRLWGELETRSACSHPGQQLLPSAPPGPWPVAWTARISSLPSGDGTSSGCARRAGHRRARLLACQAGKARRTRSLGGSGLPCLHRPEPYSTARSRSCWPDRARRLSFGGRSTSRRPCGLARSRRWPASWACRRRWASRAGDDISPAR